MKKFLNVVGVAIFVIVAFGLWIETADSIPDNAQVRVIPSKRLWIPNDEYNRDKIENSIKSGEFSTSEVAESIPTTYAEMKTNPQTKGFSIPKSWEANDDNYKSSKSHSILVSFVATKRWNADGTWNY